MNGSQMLVAIAIVAFAAAVIASQIGG